MTAELGETEDPKQLIEGEPAAITENATALRGRGETFAQTGGALAGINTGNYWSGEGADAFREVFRTQPPKWMTAGEAFTSAARILDGYSGTLSWAQGQAAESIRLWKEAEEATRRATAEHDASVAKADALNAANAAAGSSTRIEVAPFVDPGVEGRAHAQAVLKNARNQLQTAGDDAASALGKATDGAPEKPSMWDRIKHWGAELGKGTWESLRDLGELYGKFNQFRLFYDPDGYKEDVKTLAAGLGDAVTHPADLGKQLIDYDTWKESPARAVGHLVPDAVAAVGTGGLAAVGKKAGVEGAEAAAESAARRTGTDVVAQLGKPDLEALADYTGLHGGFSAMNDGLRTGKVDAALQTRVDAVNTALNKLPDHEGLVFRGTTLPPEVLDDYRPGGIVTERAFTSTSMDPESAFAGNVEFEVYSVTGKDVSEYSRLPEEQEVLFRSGTDFYVAEKIFDPETGITHITLMERGR